MKNPVFSIITVTYNAEKVLEKTISSILSQTAAAHIEYIIVDGASKDGTVDIIKKYEARVNHWISKPDSGLYDAMNKGLKMATGDYVWFINAGDEIFDSTVLQNLISNCEPNADVYFGETEEMTEDGQTIGMRRLKTPEKLTWKSFKKGMLVCHQSIIVKRTVAGSYNLDFKIAADIEWVIASLKSSKKIVNTHLILSRFAKGGTSGKHIKKALKERFSIMTDHYGIVSTVYNHIPIGVKFFWFLARNKRF